MVNPYFLKSWLFGLFIGLQLGFTVAHFLNLTIFLPLYSMICDKM